MSKRKKSNGSFVHQFLDLYTEKGAGFAMLLLYKHYKDNIKGVNDVLPSLKAEAIKRKVDVTRLFKELNSAVGTIDGTSELRTGSGNDADQSKNEDGPRETRANDGSSGSQEEGSS